MKQKLIVSLGLVLIIYFAAWETKHRTGMAKPMANARYFYFGQEPASWSDKFLYAVFFPIYKAEYCFQSIKNEGHWNVHWSDRKEATSTMPKEQGISFN